MNKLSIKKTKETPKKVTLKELIERKMEIMEKKKEKRKLYVDSLDGTITIEKPDSEICTDALDMEEEEGNAYVVYNCVIDPNLKDKELQKAYEVEDNPLDIVDKIFDPGEVGNIAKECLKFAGFIDSVKVVEDLKN